MSVAFGALWYASHYFDALLDNGKRRIAAQDAAERTRDALGKALLNYAADLKIAAAGRELRRLAGGDVTARGAVAEDFAIVVREKPFIAHLRYLDYLGNEVIRVDQGPVDRAVIVDEGGLRNVSDQDYFEHAVDLPEGGLYISTIDLGIEYGVIEVPWQPLLRLATPIHGADGAALGVVVVGIAVGDVLATVGPAQSQDGGSLELLNQDGYWMAGVPRNQLWGFMFGRDTTMAVMAPAVWRRIAGGGGDGGGRGAFDVDGVHHLYRTLRPVSYVSDLGSATAVRSDGAAWTVLATVPPVSLTALWTVRSVSTLAGGLVVIALVCLGWTRAVTARRAAEANRRRAEAELVRFERLAGLGALVAGVAHELNTPIGNAVTVASTMAQQAERFATDVVDTGQVRRSTLSAFVKEMQSGTAIVLRGLERANTLIGHFKQVAVDQTSEQRRDFRMTDLARDIVDTVRPQFRHSAIALDTEILSTARLDSYPGALGQVLINLVTNARIHAFDEGDVGQVTIVANDLPDGEVEIAVHDTGKGMEPALLARAFEPFVTTRLGQGGSGLGLSVAFNIVTTVLGGTLGAESRPGAGTTMTVRIPVSAPTGADTHPGRAYDVGRSAERVR